MPLAARSRRFYQVDVFTTRPGYGNALAVIVDADGLDDEAMQRFARWTNLSETTFLLPPTRAGVDYRVRIFTPRQELPFAGHPSVGSAHVAIDTGLVPAGKTALVQECAAGLLPVRVEAGGAARRIFVRAPAASFAEPDERLPHALGEALGVTLLPREPLPRNVNVGPWWLIADLEHGRVVRELQPDFAAVAALTREHGAVGIGVFGRETGDAAIAVRAFCPADGIPEDPVTGSANAAIGAYLRATGALAAIGAHYRASQGRELGRDGYVDVRVDAAGGEVDIGGATVTVVRGEALI